MPAGCLPKAPLGQYCCAAPSLLNIRDHQHATVAKDLEGKGWKMQLRLQKSEGGHFSRGSVCEVTFSTTSLWWKAQSSNSLGTARVAAMSYLNAAPLIRNHHERSENLSGGCHQHLSRSMVTRAQEAAAAFDDRAIHLVEPNLTLAP